MNRFQFEKLAMTLEKRAEEADIVRDNQAAMIFPLLSHPSVSLGEK